MFLGLRQGQRHGHHASLPDLPIMATPSQIPNFIIKTIIINYCQLGSSSFFSIFTRIDTL